MSQKPSTYVLPNRGSFSEWVYETYQGSLLLPDTCSPTGGSFAIFPHQVFVRDYMASSTPFSGLLLYHGLGVGKTCAAIAVAEMLKKDGVARVVVMTQASLKFTFRNELKKCGSSDTVLNQRWARSPTGEWRAFPLVKKQTPSTPQTRSTPDGNDVVVVGGGDDQHARAVDDQDARAFDELSDADKESVRAHVDAVIGQKYDFINYNGVQNRHLKTNYPREYFDRSLVIIDEAHRFVSRAKKAGSPCNALYERIFKSSARKVLLTGTPIINEPYELSLLLNLTHGPVRTWLMRGVSEANLARVRAHPSVDSAVATNQPSEYVVRLVPDGFERRSTDSYELVRVVGGNAPTQADVFERFVSTLNLRSGVHEDVGFHLPMDEQEFERTFVDRDGLKVRNRVMFMRRIQGLVSHFDKRDPAIYPRVGDKILVRVPMSDYQYSVYSDVRLDEIKKEQKRAMYARISKRASSSSSSNENSNVYKSFSRAVCNFAFPEEIKRPYPSTMRIVKELDDQDEDGDEIDVDSDDEVIDRESDEEFERESDEVIDKEFDEVIDKEFDEVANKEFDEVANKEFDEVIDQKSESTSDEFEKDGAKKESDGEKGDEFDFSKRGSGGAAASSGASTKAKAYAVQLERCLKQLERSDALGDASLGRYSPKMAEICKRVGRSPGSCLVYSEFKNVEGMKIVTMSLEARGYARLRLVNGELDLYVRSKKVPAADAERHRGRVYIQHEPSDVDAATVLVDLFNGNLSNVPADVLRRAETLLGTTDNLRGRAIRVVLISMSGSEGISLKNVRQVHLLEPYWNDIRVQQVIGRAVRAHSHSALPDEDRTVEVYQYCVYMTEAQKESASFLIRVKDDKKTADEMVFGIAMRKAALSRDFLSLMKAAAVDCNLHREGEKDAAGCFNHAAAVPDSAETYPARFGMDTDDERYARSLRYMPKAPTPVKTMTLVLPGGVKRPGVLMSDGTVADADVWRVLGRIKALGRATLSDDGKKITSFRPSADRR